MIHWIINGPSVNVQYPRKIYRRSRMYIFKNSYAPFGTYDVVLVANSVEASGKMPRLPLIYTCHSLIIHRLNEFYSIFYNGSDGSLRHKEQVIRSCICLLWKLSATTSEKASPNLLSLGVDLKNRPILGSATSRRHTPCQPHLARASPL